LTYLGFGLATLSWQVWVLFIIYGPYHGLTEPAEKALVKDLAPIDIRGRAYGVYTFLTRISAIAADLLTGWLWQEFGPLVALAERAGLAAVSAVALSGGKWDGGLRSASSNATRRTRVRPPAGSRTVHMDRADDEADQDRAKDR
jgi:hypothetical protein